MTEKKYLRWYNKVGYGSGDIAGNVVYALLSSFVMIFLTNTVGLSSGIVGTLIAVSKLFDGVTDIFFGAMIDKTHTRMGKARPWMLWGYVGCAVTLAAIFFIPADLSDFAKYAWFFIAYTLLNAVFYTANNIAYSALTALVTKNSAERVQMGSIRFVFAFGTSLLIQSVTVRAVAALGGGASGWRWVAIIYAVIGLVTNTLSVLAVKELPEEEREQLRLRDLNRLDRMTSYCKTTGCLRAFLLRYFGQEAPESCGACGNCSGVLEERDITVEAQKILSAVTRVERQYRSGLGIAVTVRLLRGSRDQRVLQLGLDKLPTYGVMSGTDRALIRAYIDYLVERGYLRLDGAEYPVLRTTPLARQVLFQGEQVCYTFRRPDQQQPPPRPKEAASPAPVQPADQSLFEALRQLRTRLAMAQNVPAYLVFSNAALMDMAARQPRTMDAFMAVSGVGAVKAKRYGADFLAAIEAWRRENGG